jgi:hypothetical protein
VVAVSDRTEPNRPRPTTQLPPRSNGKSEATTALYKLLMMDKRMPEICWAVFKRRAINLRDCYIWFVDLFWKFYLSLTSSACRGLCFNSSCSQTHTYSVGLLWTSDRPLAEASYLHNTQNSHTTGRIRTHNPTKRAAAKLRLRLRDHRGRSKEQDCLLKILT